VSAARAAARKPVGVRSLPPAEEEVRQGPLPPVVLLGGEEEYLVEQALAVFWDHATDPALAEFNRDLFQADEADREQVFAQAASFPMMAERRLVVLRRCEKAPAALLNDLAVYLERPSPSTCLVLLASTVDKRRKVWTRVAELGWVFQFDPLKGQALSRWLAQACAARGHALSARLADRLAEQLGSVPLRMAEQEVEKLCLLAGPEQPIQDEELATALGMEPGESIFDFADALLGRQTERALRILRSLLRQSDAAYTLVPFVGKSLGRAWFMLQLQGQGLGQSQISQRLGLNDWAVGKALQAARGRTAPGLEEALAHVAEADMGLKGDSPLSPAQVLFQMVVRICKTR
jgi:DNA polymerase-3 subunit delta